MTTYTDDEIKEALLRAVWHVERLSLWDAKRMYGKDIRDDRLIFQWLASEYPRLKADAEKWRVWDAHNYTNALNDQARKP